MPLYRMTDDRFEPVSETSFFDLKVMERNDIQRLLRCQIEVLGEDLYVLTEEFGDWEESRRRIDLLAIDKQANLVVIEIKRTSDGGHMDLQALRYASMVSTMTFERAVQLHGEFLVRMGEQAEDAVNRIVSFLTWEDDPEEEVFAPDVRILLVSEDFGKELTTAVLWLRDHNIDIRCIRLKPYQDGDKRLVDVQQIIPLPEAHDYQVKLREKEQEGRKKRAERYDLRLKFWEGLVSVARNNNTRHANIKPGPYGWLGSSSGVRGLNYNYTIGQQYAVVELYIDRGDKDANKAIFDRLFESKAEIEQGFGQQLSWERLNARRASRIKCEVQLGGYSSPEDLWPDIQNTMVDLMTKLENVLKMKLSMLGI